MHRHYVISVVSRDRIGIVADVSRARSPRWAATSPDLRQSVLRDYFTMILLASFPEGVSADAIQLQTVQASASDLPPLHVTVIAADAADEGSAVVLQSSVVGRPSSAQPNYLLTAPARIAVGFVASVAAFCARNGLNILDLCHDRRRWPLRHDAAGGSESLRRSGRAAAPASGVRPGERPGGGLATRADLPSDQRGGPMIRSDQMLSTVSSPSSPVIASASSPMSRARSPRWAATSPICAKASCATTSP